MLGSVRTQVAELLERYSELDDTEKFAGTPAFQPPEVARGSRSFSATKVLCTLRAREMLG